MLRVGEASVAQLAVGVADKLRDAVRRDGDMMVRAAQASPEQPDSQIHIKYLTTKEETPLGSGSGCQGSGAGASLHRHGPPAVAGTARPASSAQRLRLRRRPAEAEPACRGGVKCPWEENRKRG